LISLEIIWANIKEETLMNILECSNKLKKVTLLRLRINNELLKALSKNKHLIELYLTGCDIDEGFMSILEHCKKMKYLSLWDVEISEDLMHKICQNLPETILRLELCYLVVNDEDIANIVKRCPHIEILGLRYCKKLTEKSYVHLLKLNHLIKIDLNYCTIPDELIKKLDELVTKRKNSLKEN